VVESVQHALMLECVEKKKTEVLLVLREEEEETANYLNFVLQKFNEFSFMRNRNERAAAIESIEK